MKDKVKEQLKAIICMRCDRQSELFSENYEKFYCKRDMLEWWIADCNIPIEDLDELLDSDLEMLKEKITSFYISLSSFPDGSNDGRLSGVNVLNPKFDVNALMDKLNISDENREVKNPVPSKHLSYHLLEKLTNLKSVLRIMKGNQGTIFIQ